MEVEGVADLFGGQAGVEWVAVGAVAAGNPMRRLGRPDEIAEAIVFLASGAASFITGTTLIADGGYTAR